MNNEENNATEPRLPHLWAKGESGNPSGRKKKTEAEKKLAAEMMEGIRNLGPKTVEAIDKIIDPANKVQAMARVRMIEILLSYILGKPSSEVKLSITADEMAEDSEIRIAALIQAVRGGKNLSAGYDAITQPEEESDVIIESQDESPDLPATSEEEDPDVES